MKLARHVTALICAVAFLLSTLAWWGHHTLAGPAEQGGAWPVEAAAIHDHAPHHASLGETAHKHHGEGKTSESSNVTCCAATCAAGMPLPEPEWIFGEPVGQIREVSAPDQPHEATIAREHRPPRVSSVPSGPFGSALA